MAIKELGKHRAKLIVSTGSASKGTRKQWTKTVTYKRKKDLKAQYDAFEAECKGLPVMNGSVEELLDTYISTQRLKGLKETTLKGYESYSKTLKSAFTGVLARDLTTYQIERFLASELKKTGKSAKTLRGYVSLLSCAYKQAIRGGLLNYDPCSAVELPKRTQPEKVILKREEISAFTEALQDLDADLRVCYELALFCGLRRSEIMGIRYEDISIPWSTISIRRTRHRLDRKDIIQDTKTESSRRKVVVPAFVMDDVAELMEKHQSDQYSDTDFLIQYAGEPMRPDLAKRKIKDFTKSHGLPDVTMHGLRHTFASMLNSSGEFDIAEISSALGHCNISTTLNIYTHLFDSEQHSSRRIADFLQKGFSEVSHENEKTAEMQ